MAEHNGATERDTEAAAIEALGFAEKALAAQSRIQITGNGDLLTFRGPQSGELFAIPTREIRAVMTTPEIGICGILYAHGTMSKVKHSFSEISFALDQALQRQRAPILATSVKNQAS